VTATTKTTALLIRNHAKDIFKISQESHLSLDIEMLITLKY